MKIKPGIQAMHLKLIIFTALDKFCHDFLTHFLVYENEMIIIIQSHISVISHKLTMGESYNM